MKGIRKMRSVIVQGPKGAFQKVTSFLPTLPYLTAESTSDTASGSSSGGISLDTLVLTVDPPFLIEP